MKPVVFVVKGYPRLSETFIAQEIRALERCGLPIHIVSLRHADDPSRHPVHAEITAPVSYLPEYLHHEPLRVLRAYGVARGLGGYRKAYDIWLRDLSRDRSRSRVRRFGQACVLAASLPPGTVRLHAHFLHTPASVARYAAIMLGLPWSCSAHAKDIYTSPDWELREKLDDCQWLVTCTASNARHLKKLAKNPDVVSLVYHGLDLDRFSFPPVPAQGTSLDGLCAGRTVTILSVGRTVEKKGYDGLLQALAALPGNLHWRFVHIGGGGGTPALQSLARELGIADKITWLGALPQDRVLAAFQDAQIFVLNSRIAEDGDRDGLPNVLMEAQSQALACVATAVSAIPELIMDGETGVLVPPDHVARLSEALAGLIQSPDRRLRLGVAGQKRVRTCFALDHGIESLVSKFRGSG